MQKKITQKNLNVKQSRVSLIGCMKERNINFSVSHI